MKTISTILCILLTSVGLFGQVKKDSLTYKVDEYFTALTNLKNFNGNVIISKYGQIILDKTYNITGETDSLKVTKDSKFIIASVSKVFIKFSILKLAELKKLHLTDKLNKFIPDFPNGEKITIEQLMHHQSGLPRELTNKDAYDSLSLSKVVDLAKLEKLQFEPGSETLYSNVGYFLLHYIIDKSSSNGYLAFIQNEIFNKMKLNNTLELNSTTSVPKFAMGFDNENGKLMSTSIKKLKKAETGNYLSTIADLYSFSQQILLGKVLKKPLALEMFGKDSVLTQSGGRSGYRSYFYKNLKTGITFIFISNYTDIPFQEATADIINILDKKPYEVPHKINRVEIQLSTEILKKYTGKFALEADLTNIFSIELIGNKLFFVDPNGKKSELHPDSENTFFESPTTKDGFIFMSNKETNQYDLILIDTGIKLKTKRLK
ncbi:serine hydrolase domain-containing protein [Flavobacterium yafengii]|uniref:Serine hydrolase domain-containing protein n=1 Tax=Flavobacterium yafengii TaxID=3041253 RepID=A0AAW6TT34_9FLAO|nr:serine hydrolase domain-containing protein [Flavobacterium yafengii]MDI5950377.1 serine hydrolase domain-containing protein [Flavobacterium yafengii]